ncbi:hypothetical protein, partial [Salmonella enterica]|uniref:hypothetical protein n=1 Tax=Salmonella enterica TaxID=28901 RepID=UPI001F45E2A0
SMDWVGPIEWRIMEWCRELPESSGISRNHFGIKIFQELQDFAKYEIQDFQENQELQETSL